MTNVWNLDLPATPMDMDPEIVGFGLCDMVRGEYLKKLHETLAQNLGALIQGCHVDQQIESYINMCMAEMEKDAIRNCMVANLYREGMARIINDVKMSTNNGSMHSALKAVIVNANIDLQNKDIPAEANATVVVDPGFSCVEGRPMDVKLSDECTDTVKGSDEFNVPSVVTMASEGAIPKTHIAFDSYDENGIFAIAVEKYRRTGIRQRSAIPAACIDPTTMRPRIVDAVLASPMNSDRVAEAYEFRRRLKELPEELRVRVDGKLDRFFRDTAGTQHAFELSEPEEQSVSFKRIVRLVVARMKPYYDAGRITKTMFKALAELVSKNFSFHTYDPNKETIAKTVDGFFADNTAYICRFEDINGHFIMQ